MKRGAFLVFNGLIMILNLGLLGFTTSVGLSPALPILSFLAGAFGFAYWMFHDK